MARLPSDPQTLHRALLARDGALLIVRKPQAQPAPAPGQPGVPSSYLPSTPEIHLALCDDAQVFAFNGHVDLGTGIRTALAQIVAEELELPVDRITMVLGHTAATPNQGPTIASATIQIASMSLRRAAVQAREHLLALAAAHWRTPVADLLARDGAVVRADGAAAPITYARLLRQRRDHLTLVDTARFKPSTDHKVIGRSVARVDIPAKVFGEPVFVHDLRLPGMRHGRVVRPPYGGRDVGEFVGRSLLGVDVESVGDLPGHVRVVVEGDFVGVVADREEQAIAAARRLVVRWRAVPPAPDLTDVAGALRRQPASVRRLVSDADVVGALGGAARRLRRSYLWPYQMHASIGPSCAVAEFTDGRLTVWSGTQNPHMLRTDLDRLFKLGEQAIDVIRMEAAGCYGRNCADDVGADAALLARADGAPVRVQLMREQEHVWEPKGAAQLIDVEGAIDADGRLLAYDFATRYPSNDAPLLALLLTGALDAQPRTLQMGDRTAVPPYRYPHRQIVCHDMAPLMRASWLRGVSALPNAFAHECFVDELAALAGADPLRFRLDHLDDGRASELLQAVADRAAWGEGNRGSRGRPGSDGRLRGRGIAYARYIHSRFPGFGAAWAAWIVDLWVDPASGRIRVERVVIGQDTGMMVNPDGVRHQIHGNVIQTLSRALIERVSFDEQGVTSREWGTYPIIGFADLPAIDVVLMPRQDEPPLGSGESASVPGAAAIANALFDATGLRFREPPFTADVIRRASATLRPSQPTAAESSLPT